MKTVVWFDVIFCAAILPGLLFLFPLGEWFSVHPDYVLLFVLWLYGVLFVGRKVLGPLLAQAGRGSVPTAVGVLFLMVAVNLLMTFTPVNFPITPASRVGQMLPHVRAMWVLFLAVNAYAIPVGYLAARLKALSRVKEADDRQTAASEALESKRSEAGDALTGEIRIKADYKTIHLPLSAIRYIEGRNNYACFHVDHREDIVSQIALKSVMDMLPDGKFVRIHRSYIVPLWRIEKRTAAQVQLMGVEEKLPVGRSFKDNVKNA
ncbi:MAG: LytTR family transcriptional regulator [Bacteroidales bacterium]|nr:LytTR family transcriptional regulator [Bacteroidales bacterium]